MTEIQAAFGIIQMARLDAANGKRLQRFMELSRFFSRTGFEDFFYMPYSDSDEAAPSWFCFPLTIKPDAPFNRREFATHLMENKIEIRPLFTGNILKHPAFVNLGFQKRLFRGQSENADLIGGNGLFLPAWGMSDGEMDYMMDILERFFKGLK
jgi:CDP-6-deoxy-D-xylo-4-hexulose-3-dehydrase